MISACLATGQLQKKQHLLLAGEIVADSAAGTPDAFTQGDHKRQRHPASLCPAAFALFGSISARGVDGIPDALGRGWQFDMLDAELGGPEVR
jgi:hypothetical protein